MEEHLAEDVSLADIANHVNISAFHFQRAFSVIVGMTPAEYIRGRRLSQAGAALARGDLTVMDAALRYGYDSPESFARAFSRFHGVSPVQAKNGSPVRFMNKYSVKIVIEGGSMMEYKIEKWDAFDLVLHTETFEPETDETAIPEIWKVYNAQQDFRKVPGEIGTCASLNDDNLRVYGIGCMAEKVDSIPDGFQRIHVPAYTWAIFKCVGPAADSFKRIWHQIYSEWLPASDYEFLTDAYLEKLLPGDTGAADYVGEMCIPVKVP